MGTVEKFLIALVIGVVGPIVIVALLRNILRRAIIAVADFLVILCTLLPTVVAIFSVFSGMVSIWHSIIVGVVGTLVACLVAALFLTLTEIARNTRRMLAYYEPQQQQVEQYHDYQNTRSR